MRAARLLLVGFLVAAPSFGCGPVGWTEAAAQPQPQPTNPAVDIQPPTSCDRLASPDVDADTARECEAICDGGDGEVCEQVARRLAGAGADPAAVAALYDKSCRLGWAHACAAADETRGAVRKEACAKGAPDACAAAIVDVRARCERGEKGACDASERLGDAMLDRFCVAGSVDSCRAACDAKIVLACAQLGTILINGERVPPDAAGGVKLLEGACDAGEIRACGTLGDLYLPWCPPKYTCLGTPKKRVVPENPEKALGYYMRGCARGVRGQCEEVLELQDGGSLAVPKAPLLVALRSACSNGKKEACGRVRDLGEEP